MQRWVPVLLLFAALASSKADTDTVIYTVVVVRGTDSQRPPRENAKLVSGRLAERLSRFRWKHYWEIRREDLSVSAVRPARLQLSKQRALGITRAGDHVELQLFRDGKVARSARLKVQSDHCEIMGGTDEKDSWFIAVRRSD